MARASSQADPLALLPSTDDAFRQRRYWDDFFAKRGSRAFEWYGGWADIKAPLLAIGAGTGRILVVGCGNSSLSAEMYDAGMKDIVNVDYSEGVIEEMRSKNAAREGMTWVAGDARATGLDGGAMSLVVDKGTLDAMLPEATAEAAEGAASMLAESVRVLGAGGRYACVSLLQRQVLLCLAAAFGGGGFRVDLAPFEPLERSPLCPFLLVITKLEPAAAASAPGVVAPVVTEEAAAAIPAGTWRFFDDVAHLGAGEGAPAPEAVADMPHLERLVSAAAFRHRSREGLRRTVPGQATSMDLFDAREGAASCPGAPTARFTLFVVDASSKRTCSALVVPRGREAEWVFGTDEGRASLAGQAGAGRLVLVRCNRGHAFPDAEEAVREEVAAAVAAAAPEGLEGPIPWLGVASEHDVVVTVAEVTSALSGGMTVEDVPDEEAEDGAAAAGSLGYPRLRRLVFFSNQAAVQSEARLTAASKPRRRRAGAAKASAGDAAAPAGEAGAGGASRWEGLPASLRPTADLPAPSSGVVVPAVDFSHLAFEYHQAVVACLAVPAAQAGARALAGPSDGMMRVCVLGLGGGGLPMFLARGLGGGSVPAAPSAAKAPSGPPPYGCCPADGVPGSEAPLVRALPPPVRVHSVELDPAVAAVARDFFGFAADDRSALTVGDGAEHIRARAAACPSRPELTLDALVVDVDAKDLTSGLSFPPKVSG